MSLHAYLTYRAITAMDPPFYALIMAAMRKADDDNLAKLKAAWPEVWDELRARYEAPAGVLPGDNADPAYVVRLKVDAGGNVTEPDDE